jgi:hypothetical protein
MNDKNLNENAYVRSIDTILNKAILEVEGYGDALEYDFQPNLNLRNDWLKQKRKLKNA